MPFEKIIVLDDELIIRKSLEEQLRKRRYIVATASTLAQAQAYVAKDHFDLMFVDVSLPDGKGTQLLEQFAKQPGSPMVVIMTGNGTIQSAVECMRLGAFDYLLKPFSIEEVDMILKQAESYSQLVKVNEYYNTATSSTHMFMGQSEPTKALQKLIQKVAATQTTVLITGENGTGKEVVANEIYRLSPLAGKPFIKVNCAAISDTLIESEFFGHEKGAFTGALQRREGRFELANNGTILLDEIGEVSLQLQAKLLRVLQERTFERVGGNTTITVDVRILATTNRNLLKAVEQGTFREDLYYRLNVFPIEVPPLRLRKDDICLLAEAFLKHISRKHGIPCKGFDPLALKYLCAHTWPGNVRELQNVIERAVILTDPDTYITPQALGQTQKASKLTKTDNPVLQPKRKL